MSEINSIFVELKATSSKNAKLAILEREKDNILFKRVIEAALNPFKMYYIKKIPMHRHRGLDWAEEYKSLEWALGQLEPIRLRQITGNAAILRLTDILEGVSEDDAAVVTRIVLKDLDCGVDTAVSKIWPKLIPEFDVMLCEPYDQKLVDRFQWPALAQLKADGMRFNAIVKDNEVSLFSRSGKPIGIFGMLDAEFIRAARGEDVVFDGELLVYDEDGFILPRKTGNGILNKAVKGTISRPEANMVTFRVWDIIPYADFERGRGTTIYEKRWGDLQTRFNEENLIKSTWVDSLEEAQMIFDGYLKDGQEGIILKDANGVWEAKRSKSNIKMKAELVCSLKITKWIEGDKKYVGMVGAVEAQSSDGKVQVKVGGGWSDEQRATLQEEDVLDAIIDVLYNARIQDQRRPEYDSLFLPRFVEFRLDKTEADHSSTIK